MSSASIEMTAIAEELNRRAQSHPVGKLQWHRAELHGMRRACSVIFTGSTINSDFAFHHGGRTELQFNVGFEEIDGKRWLRHGVAFSFELSLSLRSIDVLVPKVRLFNDYMRANPLRYADMQMWHYREPQGYSGDYQVAPIKEELVESGTFVFLGRRQELFNFEYENILRDFDDLLDLYKFIESNGREEFQGPIERDAIDFQPGWAERPSMTTASYVQRELNVLLKHNDLQAALCRRLEASYGKENVAGEYPNGLGKKIDVVLRRGSNEFWYYEIKTAFTPRACLREALGQILEYAYWPGAREPSELIICGENPLDHDGKAYVSELRRRFNLPISYEQIVL